MSAVFVILTVIASLFLLVPVFAYFRRKPEKLSHTQSSFQPPAYHGLFAAPDAPDTETQTDDAATLQAAEERRATLLARAAEGDFAVLAETHPDTAIYFEALDALVDHAVGADRLDELTSCIAQDDRLRVNARLAKFVMAQWIAAPQPSAVAGTLHFLARADDAAIYQAGVRAVLREWRADRLAPLTAAELRAAIESQYWLLSAEARGSGGGFVLKEFLAAVRRELLAARSASA